MMEWWQAAVLALIQGLTEFLPVSSSGHLVLMPRLFGWPDQGLAFDVAVHVGTLLGVLLYFRRDLAPLARGGMQFLRGRYDDPHGRMAVNLLLATIPVGLAGLLGSRYIEEELRSPFVVAFQLSVFGIVLWLADRFSSKRRGELSLSTGQALLIGLAQALALIPGTSRSGITMSAGLVLGLTREAAARFAFLLAIPGIAAAGIYEGHRFFTTSTLVDPREMLIGVTVAAVVGYACIHYFLRFIARIGFLPFAVYRLVLAAVVAVVFYEMGG
jgi:undecaprenyl-diphosphatase